MQLVRPLRLVPVAFSGSVKDNVDVGGVSVEIKSIRADDAGRASTLVVILHNGYFANK